MDICISHHSALDWYVHHRNPCSRFQELEHAVKAPDHAPEVALVDHLVTILDIGDQKLDVMVSSPNARHATALVSSHLCSSELPEGALIPLGIRGRNVWITSPALTFVQVAGVTDRIGAIAAGNSLCSSYMLDWLEDVGVVYRPSVDDAPLVSVRQLLSFVRGLPEGFYGKARALRALKYVHDGARSPMEWGLAMEFELPPGLGGYALGKVTLNEALAVYDGMDSASRRTYVERIPDITIAAHGRRGVILARIDYDAYSVHSNELREVMDSRRRNQLASYAGMVQFSLRTSQVMRYSEFEQEIEWIRISLGQRRKDGGKRRQGKTWDRRITLWQRVISGERDCYTGRLVKDASPMRGRC